MAVSKSPGGTTAVGVEGRIAVIKITSMRLYNEILSKVAGPIAG
jgi:hypothetical protein